MYYFFLNLPIIITIRKSYTFLNLIIDDTIIYTKFMFQDSDYNWIIPNLSASCFSDGTLSHLALLIIHTCILRSSVSLPGNL
jgi:hypothetical protein